jgi:hypothetical protein
LRIREYTYVATDNSAAHRHRKSRTSISIVPHSSLRSPGASFTAGIVGSREQQINNPPQVGQWYTRLDTNKDKAFLVTGFDEKSNLLPLAIAGPPEDWTEALDDVEVPGADALG